MANATAKMICDLICIWKEKVFDLSGVLPLAVDLLAPFQIRAVQWQNEFVIHATCRLWTRIYEDVLLVWSCVQA
jgi:hypothetical protein